MKTLIALAALAALSRPVAALAADGAPAPPVAAPAAPAAAAAAPAAPAPQFSSRSTLGAILGNPNAKAVLFKTFPELAQAPEDQLAMGYELTLRDIQQFAPDVFTDAAMRKFDEEMARPPAPADSAAPKPPEAPKPAEPARPAQ